MHLRDDNDSIQLLHCQSEEELINIIDEIESDYRHQNPIWECDGTIVLDGKDINPMDITSQWEYADFLSKHEPLISTHDCCAVSIYYNKGYSEEIDVEAFSLEHLNYDQGIISYGDQELWPDEWQGRAGEIILFRNGEKVQLS